MPGHMETAYPLTADEKINIRLRNKAGEGQKAIAEDYDVPLSRIRALCVTDETKEKHRLIKQRTRQLNMVRAGQHHELRKQMVAKYKQRTGRDLVADLAADTNPCPSPPNS